MDNLPAIMGSKIPAHLKKGGAKAVMSELTGGVMASFPIISYRGKVWRVRKGGNEVSYVDADGGAIPSIEVVIIRSNPLPSKTFYDKKYEEGSNEQPRCWSSDGIKPDQNVQNPISKLCAACANNAWGSRITEANKKGRACSDVRRLAVVFAHELAAKGKGCHKFLMRVPPASLNPLKEYAEKVLDPHDVEYFAVVTKVGFDPQAAHPKLTFKAARWLDEAEYAAALELREDVDVRHILSESEFNAEAGITGTEDAAPNTQNEVPTPASAPRKSKPTPVDEEDVPVGEATDEGDEDEEEETLPLGGLLPPAPPLPAGKKTPKKKKVKAEAVTDSKGTPHPAAPAAGAMSDFDSMLDSILNQ